MNRAPISLCIIVKNEPLIEQCLKSIRNFVNEIIIVDTGSTDNTPEISKKYCDIFSIFTECNDPNTGLIDNFSLARQYSFDLASQPWIMWCDADDIILNPENLNKLTTLNENVMYYFPYEVFFNSEGNCTLRYFRERLFNNKNNFRWAGPVHEVIVAKNTKNLLSIKNDEIVFKHCRDYTKPKSDSNRNLRILQKCCETNNPEPRQLFYLANEYKDHGMIDKAILTFEKYIKCSFFEDEKTLACIRISELFQIKKDYENAKKYAFQALEIKENWSECYFNLCKLFYFIAQNNESEEKRNWERCVFWGKKCLEMPKTDTVLFVNPLHQTCEIHKYLNFALNKIGKIEEALESVLLGMKYEPTNEFFLNNKRKYEEFLGKKISYIFLQTKL